MIASSTELEELIDSTVNIPTIPTLLLEINEVCASSEGSAHDAATVIERDPAMGAKVLRLVNSSFYALPNPISSIGLACSILGLKVIKNLVVQATVIDQFADVPELHGFDPTHLWAHSFKVAVAARMLAARAPGIGMARDDAYTCGLIHDVGKMVLLASTPGQFAEALAASNRDAIPLAKAEGNLFGFSHAHVGGLLARRWKLAPELQAAVTYHHSPATDAEHWAKGFLIAAANTIAHQSNQAPMPWRGDRVDADAMELLGIDEADWREIRTDVASVGTEI